MFRAIANGMIVQFHGINPTWGKACITVIQTGSSDVPSLMPQQYMAVGTQNFFNCIYEGGREREGVGESCGKQRGRLQLVVPLPPSASQLKVFQWSKRTLTHNQTPLISFHVPTAAAYSTVTALAIWLFTSVVNCTGPHITTWIKDDITVALTFCKGFNLSHCYIILVMGTHSMCRVLVQPSTDTPDCTNDLIIKPL